MALSLNENAGVHKSEKHVDVHDYQVPITETRYTWDQRGRVLVLVERNKMISADCARPRPLLQSTVENYPSGKLPGSLIPPQAEFFGKKPLSCKVLLHQSVKQQSAFTCQIPKDDVKPREKADQQLISNARSGLSQLTNGDMSHDCIKEYVRSCDLHLWPGQPASKVALDRAWDKLYYIRSMN